MSGLASILPQATLLDGKYRIERVLGAGGFGITYEATDVDIGAPVAIKEYFPAALALRDATQTVRTRSEEQRTVFEQMRRAFLSEAQTLAQFDDASIVHVLSVFESLGTAYMVMRYEAGENLKSWLARLARAPEQSELDRIVARLLGALDLIHSRSYLHRDIATDNIILRPDGNPVLIDFGASRHLLANATGSLSAIVKPGFSPIEQYSADSRSQGPWTDIYALGATLYACVTGNRPPDGTQRVIEDSYVPSVEAARGRYRPAFLEAIDWALAIRPKDRPQSVAEWRDRLFGEDLSLGEFDDARFAVSGSPAEGPAEPRRRLERRSRAASARPPQVSPATAGSKGGSFFARLFGRKRSTERSDETVVHDAKNGGGGPSGLVQCTVFAPPAANSGTSLLVQVFLHPPLEAARVETIARAFDDASAKRQTGMLAAPINVGQRVDIAIVAPGLAIDEPHQHVIWRGVAEAANFLVTIPADSGARDIFPVVLVSIDGAPYGRLVFKLTSVAETRRHTPTPSSVGLVGTPYRRAFCSYSSSDVVEVTRAVQVLSLLGWSCFHDKSSLKPGEAFAGALREEIERSDLFLLFWSSAARQSEWVRREAEWALSRQAGSQGVPDILPVILEGPPPAPPFEFLSDRHFDDRYQYMIAALRARPQA